jgi:hypothetical protein
VAPNRATAFGELGDRHLDQASEAAEASKRDDVAAGLVAGSAPEAHPPSHSRHARSFGSMTRCLSGEAGDLPGDPEG